MSGRKIIQGLEEAISAAKQTDTDALDAGLRAVELGYEARIVSDGAEGRLIVVENPDFQEDNGSSPNLIVDIGMLLAALRSERVRGEESMRERAGRLGAALKSVLDACDQGRMRPALGCGAGGMTIEANIRGSIYTGVPAWPIEEARNVFYEFALPTTDQETTHG